MATNYSVTIIEEYHYYAPGYKILITHFNNRFKQYADHKIGEYQTGFRAGKSTADQIFTVKENV